MTQYCNGTGRAFHGAIYRSVLTFMLAIPLPAMAADTLTVYLSGDAWNGNAQATVSINGSQALIPVNQTSSVLSVSAVNASDAVQAFTFTGTFGANPQVSVSFINDASDGTLANDRNLYLDGFVYNAVMYRNFKKELGYNQTVTYPLAVQPPAPHRAADFLRCKQRPLQIYRQSEWPLPGCAIRLNGERCAAPDL